VFERALMEAVPLTDKTVPSGELDLALRRISEGEAPSLSTFIRSRASLAQIREFVIPPLGLPAQGSRSALVGDRALLGRAKGGAD
jgi:hypothetical protein